MCLSLSDLFHLLWQFPGHPCSCTRHWRQWHPTPVLLPGKSHGRRSLMGCSPWGREESDTIERLHFHFSRSCIGGGNGNPLQCSCLENPRDAEPGGLPSMGLHRVGHDWSDLVVVVVFCNNIPFHSTHSVCATSSSPVSLWMDTTWLPCPGFCKQCCSEHWHAHTLSNHGFLWIHAQEWDCCVIWWLHF